MLYCVGGGASPGLYYPRISHIPNVIHVTTPCVVGRGRAHPTRTLRSVMLRWLLLLLLLLLLLAVAAAGIAVAAGGRRVHVSHLLLRRSHRHWWSHLLRWWCHLLHRRCHLLHRRCHLLHRRCHLLHRRCHLLHRAHIQAQEAAHLRPHTSLAAACILPQLPLALAVHILLLDAVQAAADTLPYTAVVAEAHH